MITQTSKLKDQKDERRGLLAKVHIAKKELALSDEEYEAILSGYKAQSSKDLNLAQLERLVKYLRHLGWHGRKSRTESKPTQIDALVNRIQKIGAALGEKRLAGLTKKICGVEKLEWCRSAAQLKQLLAVLEKLSASPS